MTWAIEWVCSRAGIAPKFDWFQNMLNNQKKNAVLKNKNFHLNLGELLLSELPVQVIMMMNLMYLVSKT